MDYKDYAAFGEVKAALLPPHWAYDYAIDPCNWPYALSGPEWKVMEDYISDSHASGIIRPASSGVGAGFFQKGGSLRHCIDYWKLNAITIWNRCPLPLLSSIIELLQDTTIFSRLDLRNLICIWESDKWKAVFNTPNGHYKYLVMLFGLNNSPAVFQVLNKDVLKDVIHCFVFVSLEDILTFLAFPGEAY